MRAMILAAGRGERMRPLTDKLPKPLLSVGGQALIVWHLQKLARAGIREIVINHAWLGEKIEAELGNGNKWGVSIEYSPETMALETAGGIATALPKLGEQAFLVLNGDVWCDWNPAEATKLVEIMQRHQALAWLLLVPNPEHHPHGDFNLLIEENDTRQVRPSAYPDHPLGRTCFPVKDQGRELLTFSGIGIYQPCLFKDLYPGQPARLAPLLRREMNQSRIIGSKFEGEWLDIGTPQRLMALDEKLRPLSGNAGFKPSSAP